MGGIHAYRVKALREIPIQVAGAVEVLILVECHLFKDIVLPSHSLLLLKQEIVGGGHLVVLIVLYELGGLLKIFAIEVILEDFNELLDNWYTIFAHYHTLHLNASDLSVPFVSSNVSDGDSFLRFGVQDFLHKILQSWGQIGRDLVVACQDLLVQDVGVGVFEGQVATGHGVEDDTTGPDIRGLAMVFLPSNHFWGCVTGASTGCLQ